jgi:nucleoside-diphosphate-sugar epimerase
LVEKEGGTTMRCLVTGGAGFIGSHITERLLKDGHSVVILDNFSSGKRRNLEFVKEMQDISENVYSLITGDIRNYDTCVSACKDIDIVFHQAALKSVPASLVNPYEYNDVNINGILNMLKASHECGVKRFVFASSSSVYGDSNMPSNYEASYPLLFSPYALTKLAGEYYLRIFSKIYGLETVSLRYFNVFGPRQALDDEYAVVIPKFINCLIKEKNPTIFGNGRQSRDFTYIDNVVEGNILAGMGDGAKLSGQVINIATGRSYSVLRLLKELKNIAEKSIEPVHLDARPCDVFRSLADISKAEKLLGYMPMISFKEGLKKTYEWFNKEIGK